MIIRLTEAVPEHTWLVRRCAETRIESPGRTMSVDAEAEITPSTDSGMTSVSQTRMGTLLLLVRVTYCDGTSDFR